MFLGKVLKRNEELIKTAINLHQEKMIPSSCFVLDLDSVKDNAEQIVREAGKYNLKLYLMTKQVNRNPFISKIAVSAGFEGVVAVNFQGASVSHRYDIPVKHLGHLCQVPKNDIEQAIALNPEVITVYDFKEAKRISGAAESAGKVQGILLRIVGKEDTFFYGQEGGIPEEELEKVAADILKLSNVRIDGVTSFPCLNYIMNRDEEIKPTKNLYTILKAAKFLKDKFDINIKLINTPGNNFSEVFKILAEAGATHVEPGQAITGATPSHSISDIKGITSHVWVSEISHIINGKAYAFGEGLWQGAVMEGDIKKALVGSSLHGCINNMLDVESCGQGQIIDYHAIIKQGNRCRIGDTVITSSYVQMQETNSYIAPVSGIHKGNPQVEAIFDNGCHPIDKNYKDIDVDLIKERLKKF